MTSRAPVLRHMLLRRIMRALALVLFGAAALFAMLRTMVG